MGERKGQNKYYPPDFDYKVHKNLSGYHGQHPLRERARKLDKGILIIRFEMPYNIWCDGCNSHIGMGVRYNAEKSKVGMYYSTPIFMFRMKCHLCPNHFEIKTDPSNHDYVITTGARRKEQRWDPTENGQIVPEDRNSQKKLALDSMYKIEHGVGDKTKSNTAIVGALVESRSLHKEDFLLNQMARKQLRASKKIDLAQDAEDNAARKRLSISLRLLPHLPQDAKQAKLMKFSSIKSFDEKMSEKRKKLNNGIFMGKQALELVSANSPTPQSSTSTSEKNSLLPSFEDNQESEARKVSVRTIQKIASFNMNKIRSDAFEPVQKAASTRKIKQSNGQDLLHNSIDTGLITMTSSPQSKLCNVQDLNPSICNGQTIPINVLQPSNNETLPNLIACNKISLKSLEEKESGINQDDNKNEVKQLFNHKSNNKDSPFIMTPISCNQTALPVTSHKDNKPIQNVLNYDNDKTDSYVNESLNVITNTSSDTINLTSELYNKNESKNIFRNEDCNINSCHVKNANVLQTLCYQYESSSPSSLISDDD